MGKSLSKKRSLSPFHRSGSRWGAQLFGGTRWVRQVVTMSLVAFLFTFILGFGQLSAVDVTLRRLKGFGGGTVDVALDSMVSVTSRDAIRPDGPRGGTFIEEGVTLENTTRKLVHAFMGSIPAQFFKTQELERIFNATQNLQDTCVLVRIRNNQVSFDARFYPPSKHGRYPSVMAILKALTSEGTLPDATFLVMLNDGFRPPIPVFGSARHWSSWNLLIPIPMGNERGMDRGYGSSFSGSWDLYIRKLIIETRSSYPWDQKVGKAFFRGNFAPQKQVVGSCNSAGHCDFPTSWKEMNRGRLYEIAHGRPDLFDVGFSSIDMHWVEKLGSEGVLTSNALTLPQQQQFKYVINVGSNQDWAERLRTLLFLNSAIIRHEAETQEWFYPLLRPYVHYIPADVTLSNLTAQVEWAKAHDSDVVKIVRQANEFAEKYISEAAIKLYWKEAIQFHASMQAKADRM